MQEVRSAEIEFSRVASSYVIVSALDLSVLHRNRLIFSIGKGILSFFAKNTPDAGSPIRIKMTLFPFIFVYVSRKQGAPAENEPYEEDGFRPSRVLPRFAETIRRYELPFRPYFSCARIPRMTAVAG